jgi:serine/threonine protein kinase
MDRKYSPQLHPSSLPQGTQVGQWLVESWRGSGTYGAVYRAVRLGEETAEPVALKVAVNPGDKRFEREATLLSRIEEAHVPALRDHGQWACADRSFPYLAMQWVEGVPLYEWSEERNPTSRQVLRLLAQVTRALAATHEARGVHRDVKGDNVLVRADGHAFLTDFGSSIYAGAKLLTWEPLPPGTATYRSPEAWRFGVYTHESGVHYNAKPYDDLFALGVTAYRLVTDEYPPATDPGQLESVIWHVDDPSVHPPPPRKLNPRVDRQLNTLILRMLSLRPEDRGTARDMARALERRAENAGPDADLPLFIWERLPRSAWSGAEAADANSLHHRRGHRAQQVVRATEQREAEPPSKARPPPEQEPPPAAVDPSTQISERVW